MNQISDEAMEYIEILAKLRLSDEEKKKAKKDMEKMLDYVDMLNDLNTHGVEPMSHSFPMYNVFREDVVTYSNDGTGTGEEEASQRCEEALANAPAQKDGMYMVPKTVE